MPGRRNINGLQMKLNVLLEAMPEAVFIFDTKGVVVEANPAARQMFGEGLSGTNLRALMRKIAVEHGGRALLAPESAVSRALNGESVRHEQRVYIRAGSAPLDALITAEPMRSASEITGAMVIIRDVSELHDLHRHLENTERFLAIGQMAADIAHDLNNVLATVSQASAVLDQQKSATEEERRFFLAMIQNAARRGGEIIQRMREHILGGKGERVAVDVATIVREALELTRPLHAANIKIQTDMLYVLTVFGNIADLRRSFSNIILNAIEAMPRGGVLKITTRKENGNYGVVIIEDNGIGIAPEVRKRIFSPYFTTKTRGTGLGLSGARRIVEAHGGRVRFESEVNRGTKFYISLPLINHKTNIAA